MSWQLFSAIDWVIVGVITLSSLLSLIRGFTREALSLGAWVVAYIVANMWAAQVSAELAGVIANDTARFVAAFVLLFVVTLVVFNLAISVTTKAVKAVGLSTFDRVLGMAFGFVRGVIVSLVILFILRSLIPPESQQILEESQLVPHLDMVMEWAQRTFSTLGEKVSLPQFPV